MCKRAISTAILLWAGTAWGGAGDLAAVHSIDVVAAPTVTLTLTVTNTGGELLQGVVLQPRGYLFPEAGETLEIGTVSPGESVTRTLTFATAADLAQVQAGQALALPLLASVETGAGLREETVIDSRTDGGTP